MAKKKVTPKVTGKSVINRRARYDYELSDELVVGIVLTGPEARAARDGHVQLRGSYVSLTKDELWLQNASFSLKLNEPGGKDQRTVDLRPRKLLAHRKQIDKLQEQKQQKSTIVPTKLLTSGRHIKLIIALGKGKKLYDKRETMKRRDHERESQRQIRFGAA